MSSKHCTHLINRQAEADAQKQLMRVNLLPQQKRISVIIRKKHTKLDLVRYLHAACFSPVHSTWSKAIRNNNVATWSGLTETLVKRHLPVLTATIQAHLHKQQQNLQRALKRNLQLKRARTWKIQHLFIFTITKGQDQSNCVYPHQHKGTNHCISTPNRTFSV